jgi:hypothetical protein
MEVVFRPEPLAPLIEQARRRWGIRREKRCHILRDGEGNQPESVVVESETFPVGYWA